MIEMLKENHRIALSAVRPNPKNYRVHTETQLRNIASSLTRFGQGRSIVCQEQPDGTYLLVAGHGVFEAARRLGYQELRADLLPASWDDSMVSGYLVADNKLSDAGHDDQEKLLALLREQATIGADLLSLGTSEQDMARMLEEMAFGGQEEAQSAIRESMRVNQEYIEEEDDGPPAPHNPLFTPAPYSPVYAPGTVATSDEKGTTVFAAPEQIIGTTPQDFLHTYNTTTIRQIVLIYSQEEYIWVMNVLSQARAKWQLDTNTDVFTEFLRLYAKEHALEPMPVEA